MLNLLICYTVYIYLVIYLPLTQSKISLYSDSDSNYSLRCCPLQKHWHNFRQGTYILQESRIMYHFKLVHVALVYTCVCSHSLMAWTNFFTLCVWTFEEREEEKKKNGWTENSGQMRKIYCPRPFCHACFLSCFWILTFLSLGYKFAFLHFSRTLTLSFFSLSPVWFSHVGERVSTVYRKRKRWIVLGQEKKEKEKFLILCERKFCILWIFSARSLFCTVATVF